MGRVGYYVTPGGEASASWRQIWVTNGASNGDVSARGVKFHFGGSSPADWTDGCFVLSTGYTKNGNSIQYNFNQSRAATVLMDFHLGAQSIYIYANHKYNGAGRIGASFGRTNLNHKLILKNGF